MERRLVEYLARLHVPTFGEPLTASIDRKTYLPIVSGRSFDSLSSQGLQVLVNVAYALALHTVAADRDLPLPGLLIIDGPSSNVRTVGYDAERLADSMHSCRRSQASTAIVSRSLSSTTIFLLATTSGCDSDSARTIALSVSRREEKASPTSQPLDARMPTNGQGGSGRFRTGARRSQ